MYFYDGLLEKLQPFGGSFIAFYVATGPIQSRLMKLKAYETFPSENNSMIPLEAKNYNKLEL